MPKRWHGHADVGTAASGAAVPVAAPITAPTAIPIAAPIAAATVASAAATLTAGGLVGLPTETVYGLAADASNPQAVAKIFAAKGRPADHPVIVHLAGAQHMREWAIDIPAAAWTLAQAFWPGPLTLILKRAPHVSDAVTGGQDTVGLRVPSHPMAQAVLAAFTQARKRLDPAAPAGVAAPSANKFGHVSPTTAQHVRDEFGSALDLLLDGGACDIGIESTIVDLSAGAARILRPGFITPESVTAALEASVSAAPGQEPQPERVLAAAPGEIVRPPVPKMLAGQSEKFAAMPRVSGSLDAHYAPRTRMLIVGSSELNSTLTTHAGKSVAVLSFSPARMPNTLHWRASHEARVYAHNMYAHLRAMDTSGCELLIVEAPPEGPAWDGINDRLRRAAFGSV